MRRRVRFSITLVLTIFAVIILDSFSTRGIRAFIGLLFILCVELISTYFERKG
jgi:hypothetical protein